ncbi:MAG: SET domain-containing protein-lysine N-methyltransferase [Reyranella sp.]|jgi:SET domain-containing protein|nr:MAG: SET domain-containing protein-lysine N-methyltransferase [Reyranella sp.]
MKRKVSKAFVYLGRSAIHGIGCFADCDVKKGEIIRIWDGKDSRWIPTAKAHASPQAHLIKRFGIRNHGGYWCPKDFLRISTGWYMNHSADPNTGSDDEDVTYHALRDIKAGEELVMDYRRMDPRHDNLSRDERVPAAAAAKKVAARKKPRRR